MAKLRVLVPEDTVNYIKNPSLRYDTTGWTAQGSAIARILTAARFGVASLQVVTTGAALHEGAFYRVSDLISVSELVTGSVYVRGTGFVRIRMIANPTGPEVYSSKVELHNDRWQRLEATVNSTGSNDIRLYVETDGNAAQAITFYVDGAQMERKAYATSYCDGDQPGCRWNIMAHKSFSSRNAYTREGGRWVTLAGPEREEENLYMTVIGGLGVAPIQNNIQPFALQPGSYYQNTKIVDRVVTLNFHAKHENRDGGCDPVTLQFLHQLRTLIMDVVKPDKTRGGQEFWLEYQDGDFPIYEKARYDGGLEGSWDIRNQWVNSFPVRLLAVSPLVQEDNQEITELTYQGSAILNEVVGRINGQWSRLNFGLNDDVLGLEVGSRQEIIAVGLFQLANDSVSAIDPLIWVNRVCYWDGTQWQALGSGANGAINAVTVAPNGYIYVTGDFTIIGGVPANRVAYWNGSAWNALGLGFNVAGLAIKATPTGDIYAGGQFTTAGGIAANYIARWNGLAWVAVGPFSGLNNFVYSLDISNDGLLVYAGGNFTDQATNPGSGLTRVTVYNTSTGVFSALGSGFNAIVRKVLISSSGALYAAGDFTLSGAQSVAYIAQWNGATWLPMGLGMNAAVYSMAINDDGILAAVGIFTLAGGVDARYIALWNGTTWVHSDLYIGVGVPNGQGLAVTYSPNGDLYVGGANFSNGTQYSQYSGITLVQNRGTAAVSPIVFIQGPATLRWIENQTTGQRCFFDLDILSGEDITIDFGRAVVQSSLRGKLFSAPLEGSDFHNFTLLPGENKIAAFMVNVAAAKMYMSHVPQHWGADATQHGDVL